MKKMKYQTTKEAAEVLGLVHYQNVITLIKEGKLKGRKFGYTWMVDKKSVLERKERLKHLFDTAT